MRPSGTCEACGKAMVLKAGNQRFCVLCGERRNIEAFRHVRSAAWKVHAAIKSGKLRPPTDFACADCGKPATEYDHRDYSRPLDIEPVCHPCNKLRGPGVKPAEAA